MTKCEPEVSEQLAAVLSELSTVSLCLMARAFRAASAGDLKAARRAWIALREPLDAVLNVHEGRRQ
jgi:hypothetical protein